MTRVFTGRAVWLAALAVALFVGNGLAQQSTTRDQAAPAAASEQATPPANQDQMGDMMARRQAMMAEMHAADQKLDDLVAKMNAARGNDRIDAMVAVINELAAQHKSRGAGMMSMPMMSMPGGMMSKPDGAK